MPFFCIHCKAEIDAKFKACPFCGEPITDFLRRHLEEPIDGKYQILSRLGIGGMGEVYKVLHTHLNSIRVIKLMRANIAGDAGAHERFLREARLATRIHHPSVATLFDFSTLSDGSFYMVWEYIEGINLHELIDERGPLSPRYAGQLAVQALMGLEAIHRAGIVHRDVSPENLMIARGDGDERVKIIDLGIAKQSGAEDDKTKTGMFVGKWKYCSPEHLGMLPPGERIDGRADLYSFGIVLYEMLTGVPPFRADTPHAYLMMHSSQAPAALRETNPRVAPSPELEKLIFRALEKDRENRFASAREFAQAIEEILPSLSDAAGAPPPLLETAEVTNEATRVSPQRAEDVATVVSVERDAPTVSTDVPPAAKTLDRVATQEEAPRTGRGALFAVAAILILLIGGGAWLALRRDVSNAATSAPQRVEAAVIPAKSVQPTTLPQSELPGHLAINAFPWANVTAIRNAASGESVEIGAGLQTPVSVDLPAGRYDVTLVNPASGAAVTRTIAIAAGSDHLLVVPFADARMAALPDFGGAR